MPRTGGVYALPPGSTFIPNTPIESAKFNALLADLVADANTARPVTAGGTGATNAADARENLGAASLEGEETLENKTLVEPKITGLMTISGTATGTLAALQATEAGSNGGPDLDLHRNSASPAANDYLGSVLFTGRDSGGGYQTYAWLRSAIVDPAAGSEDGRLEIITAVDGTLAEKFIIWKGLWTPGVTGGDKGAGTINAAGLYQNGLPLAFSGQLLHIRDVANSGSNGGSIAANAWRTRALDTVVTNEISSAALSSNQISLPAGTYFVMASATYWMDWTEDGNADLSCVLRLRDVTNNVTLSRSLNAGAAHSTTTNDQGRAGIPMSMAGRFTLSGTTNVELQHYATKACTAGNAMGTGEQEVYADVLIWRIA